MSDVIVADYDQLEGIAERFERSSDEVAEMIGQVDGMANRLAAGWVGLASDAFFDELGSVMLPGAQRLMDALAEAGRVTRQIIAVMQAAEEEAAAPFRGTAVLERNTITSFVGEPSTTVGTTAPTNGAAAEVGLGGGASLGESTGRVSSESLSLQEKVDLARLLIQKGFHAHGFHEAIHGRGAGLFKPRTTPSSVLGPLLSVFNGAYDGTTETIARVDAGEDFSSALSTEAGEATAETLSRLGLYSNPFTGVPTFIHDAAHGLGFSDTDYIETYVGEPVGYASNVASDAIAGGAFELFGSHSNDEAVNLPRLTISQYERFGEDIPPSVASSIYKGLLRNEGEAAADSFINQYAAENDLTVIHNPVTDSPFLI